MKKAYQYIALAAVALSFAACSQEEDFTPQGDLKDTPITIQSAGVAELSTRVITNDNILVGTDEDNAATLSVFVTSNSTDNKYKATNMKWEHNGTAWSNQSESTVLFEGASSSQQIYACSPFAPNAASGSVTVTAADQIDWLVATEQPVTSNSMDLTMTHALAKLVLQPTFGTEITDQTILSVEVGGMYASGKLNIATNEWSDCGTANATLTMTNEEVLVIPMSNCTSFPITVIMADGRTFKTDVSLAEVNNELASGIAYTINLQVGKDEVATEECVSYALNALDSRIGR